MKAAATAQKAPREYRKHGDTYREHLLWREGIDAIDGRTRAGKVAKTWRREALQKKGGRSCPIDLKQTIDAAAFYLWRALELRSFIVADALKRKTPVNRRRGKLPSVNEQHDLLMRQWREINEALGLSTNGLDLARRLMLENGGQR
jgi:hypothetical protein